jgi:hypothetical protein
MSPSAKKYNVLKTEMEGMKVKTRLKSTSPVREWEIEIRCRTNTERDAILTHYEGQNGSLTAFNWTAPTFFGGETYFVRYKEFEYENPEGLGNVWNFRIIFEEVI